MSDRPETVQESPAVSPGELVRQPHGGAIRRGSKPGNTPGTGRPPDEFKRSMRAMACREDVEAYLLQCLAGKHGPQAFLSALNYATDRGYGKAPQAIEHTGQINHAVVVLPQLNDDDT